MKHDYFIQEFGAVADGRTLNTAGIQSAIDACSQAGGGRVVCGPGTWRTGSIQLKSHVDLHLISGCRLTGSRRLEDYTVLTAEGFHTERAAEHSALALVWAAEAEDIALTGGGVVDGQGLAFYADPEGGGKLDKPPTPRPRIGMFYRCSDVRVEDLHLVDSACWTLWFMQCEGVRARGLDIRGNRRMRNIDGLDVDACRDVTISDCRMDTEDDCIAVRAMQPLYDAPAVCENVTVTNCVLRSGCQGVRVGCPSDGVIRDCTFSNLIIDSGSNGILFENPHRYLSAHSSRTADISGLTFSGCVVKSRRCGIRLSVEPGIALRQLAHVSFADMRISSGEPCMIQGCPQTTIRDIRFSNVRIQTASEDALLCRHCEGIHLSAVELCAGARAPGETIGA